MLLCFAWGCGGLDTKGVDVKGDAHLGWWVLALLTSLEAICIDPGWVVEHVEESGRRLDLATSQEDEGHLYAEGRGFLNEQGRRSGTQRIEWHSESWGVRGRREEEEEEGSVQRKEQ